SITDLMVRMGREREAALWMEIAASAPGQLVPKMMQLQDDLAAKPKIRWQASAQNPLNQIALDAFPKPDLRQLRFGLSEASGGQSSQRLQTAIRMENQAQERGLKFSTNMGDDPDEPGMMIFQSVGSGACITDFDNDGWPDVYFPSSDGKALQRNSGPGALFQNREGSFTNVVQSAGAEDSGFGHGVTSGDFNDDGFPDLLICNSGKNTLLQNNGDGTFAPVENDRSLSGNRFSTSAAMADVDGDGFVDLVELNYCEGEEPFTRQCYVPALKGNRSCAPRTFGGQLDVMWRGRGDGGFDKTDALSGSIAGRGLGIVVGRLIDGPTSKDSQTGIAKLQVFIANDMSANQLWICDENDRWADAGAIRGLAHDFQSQSQGSMGIAHGDFDNDGDMDFLVTNYRQEHNNYLQQLRNGLWSDRAGQMGLIDAAMPMVAFGTEAIDLDGDGRVELVVSNGHVDQLSHTGAPFEMPIQVFAWNAEGDHFSEIESQAIGDYFANAHLGRTLLSGDFDRDGQLDLLVTHLYEPAALLINRSRQSAPATRFRLVATQSAREPIGAKVRVTTTREGGETIQRTGFVTTGDGYMGRNEAIVTVPMPTAAGDADAGATTLRVDWPSGKTQTAEITPGGEYLLIESSGSRPDVLRDR
ncbi:MAG: CRTAC1 family protein, partial [Planctomycetota bacterium]